MSDSDFMGSQGFGLDVLVRQSCGDDIHRDVGGAVGIAEVGVTDLRGLEFGAGGVEVIPAFEEDSAGTACKNRAASVGRVTVERRVVCAVGFAASEFESQAAVLFDVFSYNRG
jgi:hypothetical protein